MRAGSWTASGNYSPIAVKQLLGMKSGIATTSTLINYGGSITIKGSTLRIDNQAYAGLPVNVYVRPKNVVDVQAAGGAEDVVDRDALGTAQAGRLVGVHADVPRQRGSDGHPDRGHHGPGRADDLGDAVAGVDPPRRHDAFSGYVAPAHAGRPVYLQQYGNKVWKSIASVKLSTSGKYAFGIKPAVRGQIAYRVWFPADADHAQAYTVNKIVTVS